MDTEMEDIHNIIDPSLHEGLRYCEMREERLEEGELIESPPQIPLFKAFNVATSEAKDKVDRLAKIEIWEKNMEREKAQKQCVGSVEGVACTRKAQTKVPLVSSTPSPLPQDSMHNTPRQGSMGSEIVVGQKKKESRLSPMNLVSENLSRTRRKKSNRSKQRKKAAELQASLQIHGLLPVPLPPQPFQEQSDRTVSQRDGAALRPKSNNNQQEVREQEVGREMTMGRSNSGGLTLQQDRLKQIADLRKRIMARKASLQAQGLFPVSSSRQNVKENSIRTLPDGNPEANIFQPHNIQEEENRQKTLEIMKFENLGSGASPQKKDSSQNITKSPKTYQVRLREQRDKMRVQIQQSALDRQKLYTVEKEREPSTSIPDEIRVLLQREKERRERLSVLDNVELVEKRKEEQRQELSVPERIRLSIENTKSRSVPTNICDPAEKIDLEIVPKQAAVSKQSSSIHAPAAPQKPWQENPSSLKNNRSREGLQLERDQGNHATGGVEGGELLPVLKDTGFLPENLNMEIDSFTEHRDKEDVVKLFSIPQNIGDMLDNARRHSTEIGEAMQEPSLRSDAIVEDTSKDNRPRSIPEMLTHLLFMAEELEEIIKMENEWFGWLGMDTDIDTDIEDWVNVTTPSPNPTIERASEGITLRATPDISSELFNISENIEDMITTENKWVGWLGMDIDVVDFAGYNGLSWIEK
ncbi:hypothetical protein BPAE_0055g00250 [Botrytis paeoniae]|uniref:Uncharacterized protein n=1 Tax=Botrytis paeoniae TaxID=278948 RepID=A0A4Z1FP91_9HELO|nr:hypothetical protein BPAE_0055g00250 [Botrytis paeoniae]